MISDVASRLELLQELAGRLAARRDDLAAAAGEDIGTPHWLAALEVDLAADFLRTMELEAPNVEGKMPYGVVAAIFPYDAAPVMLARVGGSALLGGNRFRFSCSSQTPRVARILEEVVRPFPEITLVAGLDNRTFGQQCVADPQVRVFVISGGGEVGAAYAKHAQAFDKLFFAGPSGLPPVILFRDAPLKQAATFLVRRAFLQLIEEHLRELVDDGIVEGLDTRVAALAFLGTIDEVVVHWLATGEPEPLVGAASALVRYNLRAIGLGGRVREVPAYKPVTSKGPG